MELGISFDDMETINNLTPESNFVIITEEFLVSGMQSGIGCNNDQLRLLGVEIPAKKGWKQTLIGKKISKETAEKFIALKGIHKKKERNVILSQKSFELNNLEKNNLIEIKEEEKNIIIYCIENSYKNDIEQGNIERAEITKNILEKLHAIKNKEIKSGTFTKPYFFLI